MYTHKAVRHILTPNIGVQLDYHIIVQLFRCEGNKYMYSVSSLSGKTFIYLYAIN